MLAEIARRSRPRSTASTQSRQRCTPRAPPRPVADAGWRAAARGQNESKAEEAGADLKELDLHVIAFNRAQGEVAGLLPSATRQAGLSLGDRAGLVLAASWGAPALTPDRTWANLKGDVIPPRLWTDASCHLKLTERLWFLCMCQRKGALVLQSRSCPDRTGRKPWPDAHGKGSWAQVGDPDQP